MLSMVRSLQLEFNPYAVPYWLCGVLAGVVALVIIARERGSSASHVYALNSVAVTVWYLWIGILLSTDDAQLQLHASYIAGAAITLIPPANLNFAVLAVGRQTQWRRWVKLAWGIGLLLSALSLIPGLFIGGLHTYEWGRYPQFTRFDVPWLSYVLITSVSGLYLYWRAMRDRRLPERNRRRASLLFAGFCVALFSGIDILPGYGVAVPPVGVFLVANLFAVTTYVTWRYRLIDITPGTAAPLILTTMSEALLVVDAEYVVRMANPAAARLFEGSEDRLIGYPLDDLTGDRAFLERLLRLFEGPSEGPFELTLHKRDGIPVELRLSVAQFAVDPRWPSAFVCVFNDVTSQKDNEYERENLIAQLQATLDRLNEANERLERLSTVDALTGVYNRRWLDDALNRHCAIAARDGQPLSIALLDLDHFKRINDTYGHLSGDLCLQAVADAIRAELQRPGDMVGRYGGEEFVLILQDTALAGAMEVAERVRRRMEAQRLWMADGSQVTVTVSIGCAAAPPGTRAQANELIADADAALYKAKRGGRNRVCCEGVNQTSAERGA